MMKTSTTLILVGIALALGVLAIFAVPASMEPEAFNDQGELFFPDFVDPFTCKALEIYEPDPDTGTVDVFNVQFEKGLWRIPSHHGYPADAKERMAAASSSLVGLKKDMICSDRIEDRAQFVVEDPRDEGASIPGRGKLIILKDGSGRSIAELIVGKDVEDRNDWVYLREPAKKRIYAVNLKGDRQGYAAELLNDSSTQFSEWIDADLLHLKRWEVNKIVLHDYSVDEERGAVEKRDLVTLHKEDGEWHLTGIKEEEERVKKETVDDILDTLDDLTIAGVRPTPDPLTRLSLWNKGFFVDDQGSLFGNEGQMDVNTDEGIVYHLFFGEVLFGVGEAVTAGTEPKKGEAEKPEENESVAVENRYLFVRVTMDPDLQAKADAAVAAAAEEEAAKEEEQQEEKDLVQVQEQEKEKEKEKEKEQEKSEKQKEKEEWEQKLEDARKRIEELNIRFGEWYYVITGDRFKKLRQSRKDLAEPKEVDTSAIGEQPEEMKEPVKNSSGLAYSDLQEGTGDAAAKGDTVKGLDTGWLRDGTEFDKNENREDPFPVTLGEGQVIKGWEEGLEGMKPGGKRKLIIPPDLGYGEAGSGDKIPSNAYLSFDIEVIEVRKKTTE